jgi:multisubunit Na+/H+ antiporter MnhB subunit
MSDIVWVGIGLNSLATLIHTFEQTNTKLSQHMLDNILSIKNGTYVDEGILIDIDDKLEKKRSITENIIKTTATASHI